MNVIFYLNDSCDSCSLESTNQRLLEITEIQSYTDLNLDHLGVCSVQHATYLTSIITIKV